MIGMFSYINLPSFEKQTININKVIKNLTKNRNLVETFGGVVWPLRVTSITLTKFKRNF